MPSSDEDVVAKGCDDIDGFSEIEDPSDSGDEKAMSAVHAPAFSKASKKGAARSKGPAKGASAKEKKAAPKAKGGSNGGGRPTKNTPGATTRKCDGCQKQLEADKFGAGSKFCIKDKRAITNLRKAATMQGKLEWWESVFADAKKLKTCLAQYHKKHPHVEGKRPKTPVILEFVEEHKHEQQTIIDGVRQMMCEREFVAWMAKAKNGALDADSAKTRFKALCEVGDEVTDEEGPDAKNKKRVSVKVKDLLTSREADICSQGLRIMHSSNKKASAEDVEKAEHRLQTQGLSHIQAKLSRRERVVNMKHASQAQADGIDGGNFLAGGKAALSIGPVGDYLSEGGSEEDAGEDADGEEDEKCDDDAADKKRRASASTDPVSKKPKVVDTVWYTRDDQVTAALASHSDWEKKKREKLESCLGSMNATYARIDPSIADMVENEKKLFNTRHLALKLVLGLGSGSKQEVDETSEMPESGPPGPGPGPSAEPKSNPNINAELGATSALSSKLDVAVKQLDELTRDKSVAEMKVETMEASFTDANLKLEKLLESKPEGENDNTEAFQGDREALARMLEAAIYIYIYIYIFIFIYI
jgi:hypothetical protein